MRHAHMTGEGVVGGVSECAGRAGEAGLGRVCDGECHSRFCFTEGAAASILMLVFSSPGAAWSVLGRGFSSVVIDIG